MKGTKLICTKRKIYNVVLAIVKFFLAFIGGGVLGLIALVVFAEPILKFTIKKDIGLGVIAAAPAVLVIYAVVLGVAGGVLGIVVYNVIRWYRRK